MPTERPLRLVVRLVSAGATNEDLLTAERVPRGELWRINHIAWEDETTAFTSARTFVTGHGYNHLLKSQSSPPAATLFWDDEEYLLGENEQIGVRMVGTTSGDALRLYIDGFRVVQDDSHPHMSRHLPREEEVT